MNLPQIRQLLGVDLSSYKIYTTEISLMQNWSCRFPVLSDLSFIIPHSRYKLVYMKGMAA